MGIFNKDKKADKEPLSLLEIIIIACFISLVFSPVGIFLMWWKTKWSKKTKIIVSGVFGAVLAVIISLIVALNSQSGGGGGNGSSPFNVEQEYSGSGKGSSKSDSYKPRPTKSNPTQEKTTGNSTKEPSPSFSDVMKKSRLPYILIFIVIIAVLIVLRNVKSTVQKDSDNPYVNTKLYKIPVPEDFVFPPVHFAKLILQPAEKIFFATPAEQKENPGDLVITDRRFVFIGKKGTLELPLKSLSSISSLSNTALLVTEKKEDQEKQHYFFVRDTQMRFVLALTRWAYAHPGEENE